MKQPVERRLAAILAADVAGYSRPMGLTRKGRSNGSRPIAANWSIPRSRRTAVASTPLVALSAQSGLAPRWPIFRPAVIAASAAAVIAITAAAWWAWPNRNSTPVSIQAPLAANPQTPVIACATAPRLSIVVLPFRNLYLADGITDDLTTDLSRISGSFVIAHNTSLT